MQFLQEKFSYLDQLQTDRNESNCPFFIPDYQMAIE